MDRSKLYTIFKIGFLIISGIAFFATDAISQTGGFAGAYSRMGFGPRGLAMGNAMQAVTREGIYAHYNPAQAAFIKGNQTDFGTSLMSFDRKLHSVSTGFRLPPTAGIQFGILNAAVSDFDGRSQSGYHTKYFDTYEYQFFVAFGLQVSDKMALGVNIKGLMASFYEDLSRSSSVGFDMGMLYSATESLKFGFSMHDLISSYRWDSSALFGETSGSIRNDKFPVRFRFGTAWEAPFADLIISAEYEIMRIKSRISKQVLSSQLPPRLIPVSEDITQANHIVRLGGAWAVHERFTLRGGFEMLDLDEAGDSFRPAMGFSLHLPYDRLRPSVDYAVTREQTGVSLMHTIGVRLHF